jgi:hypothetical protein
MRRRVGAEDVASFLAFDCSGCVDARSNELHTSNGARSSKAQRSNPRGRESSLR